MSTDTAPIYVIGHKNPDTDSICSAIAYAELKNLLHGGGYVAARAGQINQETQYVMNFFQTQPPFYVSDVMTDVSDIEIRKTQGVSGQYFPEESMEYDAGIGSCYPADHR